MKKLNLSLSKKIRSFAVLFLALLLSLAGLWFLLQAEKTSVFQSGKSAIVTTAKESALLPNTQLGNSDQPSKVSETTVQNKKPAPPRASNNDAPLSEPDRQPVVADAKPASKLITISINGVTKGQLEIGSGWNQCDVLNGAHAAGLITGVLMKYNENYKTMAVLVIDGVGDSNKVGWVYTINGKSPPYGCSQALANGGDVVAWKYVN